MRDNIHLKKFSECERLSQYYQFTDNCITLPMIFKIYQRFKKTLGVSHPPLGTPLLAAYE
jgi:hypothetical protein